MEDLLSRYRNLTILLIVVVAQLLYLAYQVRTNRDERLIRVWAATTVTPVAGVVEAVRRNTIGFLEDYFILLDVREQNRHLREENSRLKMANIYYRNELTTAERAQALSVFEQRSQSKTEAARVTGNSTTSTAKAVFIDRGSTSGVEKGMAVVTPDGIVGKVIAVYPLASQVLLVTDPTFSVGVESQKGHVHGTLHCESDSNCLVNYVQNEEKVDSGEAFYTSGEDRVFPKGFPVGTVSSAKAGQGMKEIHISLSGAPGGAQEVLVVLEGVHQQIPDSPVVSADAKMLPPPPSEGAPDEATAAKLQTEADKVKQKYEEIGKSQNHVYGQHGSAVPNFNASTQPGGPPNVGASPAAQAAKTATPNAGENATPPILGARPNTKPTAAKPAVTPAAKPDAAEKPKVVPEPPLPLGAPKRKTTAGNQPQ